MAGRKHKRTYLTATDANAFTVVNALSASPVLIVCDHASNTMPKAAKNLGLKPRDIKRHVAWDPGTAHIGRYLSKALDARLHLANYSRLICDLNRGHDHPDCMRAQSDDVTVPGNQALTAAEKDARAADIYWPYHDAITDFIDARLAEGRVPFLLSVHSFTPQLVGEKPRPWHIGLMWNRQEKISQQLLRTLRRQNPALSIGGNKPYSMKGDAGGLNTIERHAERRGIPYIAVEFRQDLVGGSKKDAEDWAELFLRGLLPILQDKKTYVRAKVPAVKKKGAAKKKAVAKKPPVKKPAAKKTARKKTRKA